MSLISSRTVISFMRRKPLTPASSPIGNGQAIAKSEPGRQLSPTTGDGGEVFVSSGRLPDLAKPSNHQESVEPTPKQTLAPQESPVTSPSQGPLMSGQQSFLNSNGTITLLDPGSTTDVQDKAVLCREFDSRHPEPEWVDRRGVDRSYPQEANKHEISFLYEDKETGAVKEYRGKMHAKSDFPEGRDGRLFSLEGQEGEFNWRDALALKVKDYNYKPELPQFRFA